MASLTCYRSGDLDTTLSDPALPKISRRWLTNLPDDADPATSAAVYDDRGQLSVRLPGWSHPYRLDFSDPVWVHRRRSAHHGPWARLIRSWTDRWGHAPRCWDVTAGLGLDSFLCHASGARLTSVERHPLVVAMLARAVAALGSVSWDVVGGDSQELLKQVQTGEPRQVDVVMMDPMFAPHQARRAQPQKPMQLLQALAEPETLAGWQHLAELGWSVAKHRVVIKQPSNPSTEALVWLQQHAFTRHVNKASVLWLMQGMGAQPRNIK